MHTPTLVLVGGGGHALVVADAARACGFAIVGTLDDHPDAVLTRGEDPVLRIAGLRALDRLGDRGWILGVGTLSVRAELILASRPLELGGTLRTIVHPTAFVSPTARLGAGVYVGPRAIVHARAVVGDHAIINSGAIVEHECEVGMNSHIAPGAILGGNVRIGADTLIGLGSRVLPSLSVGDRCVIGAGAMVVRSVLDGQTAVGVPARVRA